MRQTLHRTRTFLLLGMTAFALTGCFDLTKDSADPSNDSTAASNNPPTISGSPPPAVVVGENYSFTPIASDPDGDTLTFSIENKPTWAEFDRETGNVSGVATLGSEGTYANIRISVSDGHDSTALPRFAVDVLQTALGSVTLSWTPPTRNEDGTYLYDLAGYGIYYGTRPGNYSNSIHIDNAGVSTYVVENLVPNTYYFSSTAFNSSGVESDYSNEATITVN